MKNMLKDTAVILMITLFAGLILGVAYQVTKEPIAAAKEKQAKEAYAEVFNDAADFIESENILPEDSQWSSNWSQAGYENIVIDQVLTAVDSDGNGLGYVLTITTHEGYGGDITFTLGIKKDGIVNGISLLSISETAGLGMKAEAVLKPQFNNRKVSNFTVTKTESTMDSQIDAISGATITTHAVTNGVNAGLYYFQTQLGGSANE